MSFIRFAAVVGACVLSLQVPTAAAREVSPDLKALGIVHEKVWGATSLFKYLAPFLCLELAFVGATMQAQGGGRPRAERVALGTGTVNYAALGGSIGFGLGLYGHVMAYGTHPPLDAAVPARLAVGLGTVLGAGLGGLLGHGMARQALDGSRAALIVHAAVILGVVVTFGTGYHFPD